MVQLRCKHECDDAGIVSCSPESFETMMSVTVCVAGVFGLMASESNTETMCLPPKGMGASPLTVSAGGQTYQQTNRFVYVGQTTADGKMDPSRTWRAWKRFRWHSKAMLAGAASISGYRCKYSRPKGGDTAPLGA